MTDVPYTSDLDLGSVTTHEELTEYLRTVRIRADNPSLRALEARTRRGPTPLSRTAASEMLKGVRFPRKERMVAFLRACGVPDDEIKLWQQAWDRLAPTSGVLHSKLATRPPGDNQRRQDQNRREELRRELLALREGAEAWAGAPSTSRAEGIWHFPDGARITLVCDRLPENLRPPQADPDNRNYIRLSALADLDTLVDLHGAVRAYNPTSRVVIRAAEDLTQQDVASHLVLIGGRVWKTVTRWFSGIFPIPIDPEDPYDRDAIVVHDQDGVEHEFKYRLVGGELVEDVGFFARGENPAAPLRTLSICSGVTTRGVRGAALCFIDPEMRGRNEQYLIPRFPDRSTYCMVMRVPVINKDPLTPDLSVARNRLFEWCDVSTQLE